MGKKVFCAMSGGVDSSVAALILKNKGYDVVGATMCLGVKEADSDHVSCCGAKAIEDAKKVCQKLDILHYVFDFSKELNEYIINPFIDAYKNGITPNPCIECNRYLKFKFLLNKAKVFGFDYIATGHYAKMVYENGEYFLKRSNAGIKDQTYFLHAISKKEFENILFPLGDLNLEKEEIRNIARKEGLPVSEKKDSYDICFIPDRDMVKFISDRVSNIKKGPILNLNGEKLGEHKGAIFYTIGQRGGLGISHPTPLYVLDLDIKTNTLVVGDRSDLLKNGLYATPFNLIVNDLSSFKNVTARIRYSHGSAPCEYELFENEIKITFKSRQEAVSPGQSVVLYDNDYVLGGGVIVKSF